MRLRGDTYAKRLIEQSALWVKGISVHNIVEDECCPDFSCCHPDLKEPDKHVRERRHFALLHKLNTKETR